MPALSTDLPAASPAERLKRSARAFRSVVWDRIAHRIGGREFASAEENPDPVIRMMLELAGIDVVVQPHRGAPFGLASRVNEIPRDRGPYDNFSLRLTGDPCEADRLSSRMVDPEALSAKWLCQAFVDKETGALRSVGVARVAHVIPVYANGRGVEHRDKDGTRFRAINWLTVLEAFPDSVHIVGETEGFYARRRMRAQGVPS